MPLIQRAEEGKAFGNSIMVETDLFEHREAALPRRIQGQAL
jgi:hypothetical protein